MDFELKYDFYEAYKKGKFAEKYLHNSRLNAAFSALDYKNKLILDLGSGTGIFSLEAIKKGFNVVSLDISKWVIKKLNEHAKQENLKTKVLVGDAFKLPFKNGSFDIIVTMDVLEHIENPEKTIPEIYRVLKKDGKVFVNIPWKPNPLTHILFSKHMKRFLGGRKDVWEEPFHNSFTVKEMKKMFSKFKFIKKFWNSFFVELSIVFKKN